VTDIGGQSLENHAPNDECATYGKSFSPTDTITDVRSERQHLSMYIVSKLAVRCISRGIISMYVQSANQSFEQHS
jgi:hypothetical protein